MANFPETIERDGRTWLRKRLFYSRGQVCCLVHRVSMFPVIGAEYEPLYSIEEAFALADPS